ncbi:hypothetical protein [Roseomonas sp. BN140053]|uniref:hypothetical protein n=1 Tax=Roseomonas sp. BN140053 TaxID=3391898 RepID=UPI0039E8667E
MDQHGAAARQVAGKRLTAMIEAGDEGGAAAWIDIVYALGEMERGARDGEAIN